MAAPISRIFCRPRVKFIPFLSNVAGASRTRPIAYAPSLSAPNCVRTFTVSTALRLKEITVDTDGEKTSVSGKYVTSNREEHVIKKGDPHHSCPICRLGDIKIKYTDVLILAQFVRADGEMLPQTVTGLCHKQHRILRQRIKQAKSAGLMPNRRPDNPHPDDVTPILDKQINEGNFNIFHETWNKKKIPHFEGYEVKHWTRDG